MAHFANINEYNEVVNVIVAEQTFIDTGRLGDPVNWIQTSYNTQSGVHLLGGTPLRKNYAAIGMIYDSQRDAFYYPQPQDGTTWVLNEDTCQWERPVPPPTPSAEDRFVHWDEATQSWYENDSPY